MTEEVNVSSSAANEIVVTEKETETTVDGSDADVVDKTVVNQADTTTELKAAEPEVAHVG